MILHRNPIFYAIDADLPETQISALAQHVGGFKIGMTYFYAHGHQGYRSIAKYNVPIFLDLKLHDIPHSVATAVYSICSLNPAIINVHAGGGVRMMQAALRASQQFEQDTGQEKPLLVAVTILTSLQQNELHDIGITGSLHDQVIRLAKLAQEAGMSGVVCSAHEVEILRKECGSEFTLITPGIRLLNTAMHDQKRVMTPQAALNVGADILVIGRSITENDNPAGIVQDILKTMYS